MLFYLWMVCKFYVIALLLTTKHLLIISVVVYLFSAVDDDDSDLVYKEVTAGIDPSFFISSDSEV